MILYKFYSLVKIEITDDESEVLVTLPFVLCFILEVCLFMLINYVFGRYSESKMTTIVDQSLT
jgi:hypothetical protein